MPALSAVRLSWARSTLKREDGLTVKRTTSRLHLMPHHRVICEKNRKKYKNRVVYNTLMRKSLVQFTQCSSHLAQTMLNFHKGLLVFHFWQWSRLPPTRMVQQLTLDVFSYHVLEWKFHQCLGHRPFELSYTEEQEILPRHGFEPAVLAPRRLV